MSEDQKPQNPMTAGTYRDGLRRALQIVGAFTVDWRAGEVPGWCDEHNKLVEDIESAIEQELANHGQ